MVSVELPTFLPERGTATALTLGAWGSPENVSRWPENLFLH